MVLKNFSDSPGTAAIVSKGRIDHRVQKSLVGSKEMDGDWLCHSPGHPRYTSLEIPYFCARII